MTRLFTDGAEFGDTKFFDAVSGNVASTTQKATGSYSYYITGGYLTKNFTASAEVFIKFRLFIPTGLATENENIFQLRSGTTVLASFRYILSTKKLTLYTGDFATPVITASGSVDFAVWYLIEIRDKIADSGDMELRVDSISWGTFSGDTKPGADTTVNNINFIQQFSSAYYIDDLALNNTSGSEDNSWCGTGQVELLKPTANGYLNEWTRSTTSTDAFALVDDIPPNDNTDYIYSATANQIDAFALADFDGTNKLIKRVWTEARAYDQGVTAAQISLGFRTTESTNYFSTTNSTLTGSYARVASDEWLLNPATSTTWQDADLDALQVLVKELS